MPTEAATAEQTAAAQDADSMDVQEVPEDTLTVEDIIAEQGGKPAEGDSETSDEFDAGLMNRALEAGFTEETAKALGSPDILTGVLDASDRRMAVVGQQAIDQKTSPAKTGDAESKTTSREPFKITLDKEEYDEDVVTTLESMNEHYSTQMDEMESMLSEILEHIDVDLTERADQQFDRSVDALGEDFHESLGKGPTSALLKSSVGAGNRVKIREMVQALQAGYQQIGKTAPPEGELFQRALRGVLGDKMKSLNRKEIGTQLTKRARQHIRRPTATGSKGLTPRQSAIRVVATKMAEMGAGDEGESGPELLD